MNIITPTTQEPRELTFLERRQFSRPGFRHELTNDQVIALAPSAGAGHAAEIASDRYSYIPTIDVIDALRDMDYTPVWASENKARKASRGGFQTHVIRLRKGGIETEERTGDEVSEIVLFNSHDTGSSFRIEAGIFRFVCANGMVVGDKTVPGVRLRHVGLELDQVIESVSRVAHRVPEALEAAKQWKTIDLAPEDVVHLNETAINARWGSIEKLPGDLTPSAFLCPRRKEDITPNLYTVTNVIQENILRGGQRYQNSETRRRGRVRAVGSVEVDRRVNVDLWAAAREIADAT
ncbi:MAG: DUF932 domain-containing protein [Verrucomicrobiota bacterium]